MPIKKIEKRRAGRPKKRQSLDIDEILKIALRHFAKKSYGGVSLQSIAKEKGIAVSLLTHHFKTKENLWQRSMLLVGNEIYKELQDLFEVIDDYEGMEKLRIFNKKIVHFSARRPEFQQCIVQEVFSSSSRSDWLIDELLRPIFGFMEGIIKEEQAKGNIKKVPQANLSSFIIGSITTLFSRSYQMQKVYKIDPYDQDQIDQHVEVINDLIFNGLRTTKPSTTADDSNK